MAGSPIIDVAAGLVFRGGRLLVAQRYDTDHQGGLWEFPGGKRRAEESYEACVRREIREELGMEVEVGRRIEDLTHAYTDRTVHLVFFQCTWLRNEAQALGCQRWAWITRPELPGYSFPAADQRLLRRLQDDLQLWGALDPRTADGSDGHG